MLNNEPEPLTGVVHASVMVRRPGVVRLTTGELQVLTTEPNYTDAGLGTETMVWSNVMLMAAASRLVTLPMTAYMYSTFKPMDSRVFSTPQSPPGRSGISMATTGAM